MKTKYKWARFVIGIISIYFLLFSCSETEQEPISLYPELIGTWKLETATLDNMNDQFQHDWSTSELVISPLGLEQLKFEWRNIPEERKIIVSNLDTMDIRISSSNNATIAPIANEHYMPPIGVDITSRVPVELIGDKLRLFISRLPRHYSYEEECPSEELALLCSVQGRWIFDFTLI